VDRVLVSQPVAALDSIVSVEAPVIVVHVTEGSVDTTLGGDGVGAGGEELGEAGNLESLRRKTESGTETSTTSTNLCAQWYTYRKIACASKRVEGTKAGGRGEQSGMCNYHNGIVLVVDHGVRGGAALKLTSGLRAAYNGGAAGGAVEAAGTGAADGILRAWNS
jgi:hypothetical protein